ncbi:MAG: undecaprenyl-phosphate alpha-N-acetylglucosaminyl 1-phosphate transferase, partial [Mycobacterium sp.]
MLEPLAAVPTEPLSSTLMALSDRGAGVPLRELALVGLTAAIVTYLATGWVRVLARR